MIGGVDDDRVFKQAVLLQSVEQFANTIVDVVDAGIISLARPERLLRRQIGDDIGQVQAGEPHQVSEGPEPYPRAQASPSRARVPRGRPG